MAKAILVSVIIIAGRLETKDWHISGASHHDLNAELCSSSGRVRKDVVVIHVSPHEYMGFACKNILDYSPRKAAGNRSNFIPWANGRPASARSAKVFKAKIRWQPSRELLKITQSNYSGGWGLPRVPNNCPESNFNKFALSILNYFGVVLPYQNIGPQLRPAVVSGLQNRNQCKNDHDKKPSYLSASNPVLHYDQFELFLGRVRHGPLSTIIGIIVLGGGWNSRADIWRLLFAVAGREKLALAALQRRAVVVVWLAVVVRLSLAGLAFERRHVQQRATGPHSGIVQPYGMSADSL